MSAFHLNKIKITILLFLLSSTVLPQSKEFLFDAAGRLTIIQFCMEDYESYLDMSVFAKQKFKEFRSVVANDRYDFTISTLDSLDNIYFFRVTDNVSFKLHGANVKTWAAVTEAYGGELFRLTDENELLDVINKNYLNKNFSQKDKARAMRVYNSLLGKCFLDFGDRIVFFSDTTVSQFAISVRPNIRSSIRNDFEKEYHYYVHYYKEYNTDTDTYYQVLYEFVNNKLIVNKTVLYKLPVETR